MYEEVTVSLIAYDNNNLELAKGYDGFVSPEGNFYKVCERGNMDAVHDFFAETFGSIVLDADVAEEFEKLKELKPELIDKNLLPKDILINLFGFVNYEFKCDGIKIEVPNPSYKGKKVTNKQISTILKLVSINNDNINSVGHLFDHQFYNYDLYSYMSGLKNR